MTGTTRQTRRKWHPEPLPGVGVVGVGVVGVARMESRLCRQIFERVAKKLYIKKMAGFCTRTNYVVSHTYFLTVWHKFCCAFTLWYKDGTSQEIYYFGPCRWHRQPPPPKSILTLVFNWCASGEVSSFCVYNINTILSFFERLRQFKLRKISTLNQGDKI